MDTILMIVTGISLALATIMGLLLARMVREERRRSDARVQLLEELAARPVREVQQAPQAKSTTVRVRPAAPAAHAPVHRRPQALDEIEIRPSAEVTAVHDIFHEEDQPSPWPRRFAVIGSMAAIVALVVFAWSSPSPRTEEHAVGAVSSAAAQDPAPLELLSLRHSQDGSILTVTGLVQNPRAGAPLSRVQATLFVFGAGGTLIASGRAPLDFTTLTPGDESPFVIRVPLSGNVERYRVGFRGHDDRVIAHVDRRSAEAVAQRAP